jgi:hypothetical protein
MALATTDRARRGVGDWAGARKQGRSGGLAAVGDGVAAAYRRMSIVFDRRGSRLVREVVEDDPSIAGRLAWLGARLTIRPALAIGSYLANAPWPRDLVEFAAAAVTPVPGSVRATIRLPHCTARLVRAAGVLPADGSRRVVLYMHESPSPPLDFITPLPGRITPDQRTCERPRLSTASRLAAMSSPEVRNCLAAIASSQSPSLVCDSSMR